MILTPLLAVLAVVYALVPRRAAATWAVVLLALAPGVAVFAARESGEAFKEARFSSVGGDAGQRHRRATRASPTRCSCRALGLGAALAGLVHGSRGDRFGRPVTTVLSGRDRGAGRRGRRYFVFRAGTGADRRLGELRSCLRR